MLDFPNSPTNGQTYTSPDGTTDWVWDGVKWTGSTGTGGGFLPLAGGVIDPGPLTVQDSATNAPGVVITPIGMYDALPTQQQSMLTAYVNMGQGRGGPYFNPTFAGNFTNTVYGSVDQSAVGLLGAVAFNGNGGVGQHCAIQAYANRYKNIVQPTTSITATLSAPGNTVSVADVSMFQMDYQPIYVNGHGYIQVSHTGTSGAGTISTDSNISVADGTVGNVVTGQNNPQLWGLNINVNDNTGGQNITSSKLSNYLVGCELDFGCSGADDGGQMLFGSPAGLRAMFTLIGNGGTSTMAAEIGAGITVGRGGGANVTWKRLFQAGDAPFSQSAFDTRQATQLSGNAVWMASGHRLAFDTPGNCTLSFDSTLSALSLSGPGLEIPNGYGINYTGLSSNSAWIGFGWTTGGQLTAYINGISIGNVAIGSFLSTGGGTISGELAIADPSGGWNPLAISNTSGNPCLISMQSSSNHSWWFGAWGGGGYWIRDNTAGVTALEVPEGAASVTVNGFLTVGAGTATVNSGTGAPTTTRPVGSIFMRTDGTAGARLYVSAGGGTWAAVAGV